MEDTTTRVLELSNLMVPLSEIVSREFETVDLLVGVSRDSEGPKTSEITTLLAERVGHNSEDVCCVSPHRLGHSRWRVITTHGTVQITTSGNDLDIDVRQFHLTPPEVHILQELNGARSKLLAGLLGHPMLKGVVPYTKIHGNVLLCGDFSLWDPGTLLALRRLFIANGAENVAFVTPVIASCKWQKLRDYGCQVLRLHPPESQA